MTITHSFPYPSDIRVSENCFDLNSQMVERQDPDYFSGFQTQEWCAWELIVYISIMARKINVRFSRGCSPLRYVCEPNRQARISYQME